ncbi:hypothetical protein tb265_18560 [Gemmatimonadetes bacterium T265]|nr:hypothetical protein tb265_18560 [Gemmatimonadetes bacterium T265]
MADRLIRNWWALGARGVAALLFGLLTLTWPDLTVGAFAGLFTTYALVDGVLTLLTAARYRSRARDAAGPRDLVLVAGVGGTALGVLAFVWRDATTAALLGIVAAWALVTGACELALALRNRRRMPMPTVLAGAGAVQVVLALVLCVAVAVGTVRVGWEIGAATIAAGALRIALAARARRVPFAARTPSDRSGAPEARAGAAGAAATPETSSGVAA